MIIDTLNTQHPPFLGELPRKRRRSYVDQRYYICFSHERQVLYSLEVYGMENSGRVWNFLLEQGKDGQFSSLDYQTLGFPYSLRLFVKPPLDLRALYKTYAQREPALYAELFRLLAKDYGHF